MAFSPSNPYEVPPYQVQPLISSIIDKPQSHSGGLVQVTCAQAHGMCHSSWRGFATDGYVGSEIYVGCSNGELLRFTLQADDPNKVYALLY